MGIDGRQVLEIRGAPAILDQLQESGIVFPGGDPQIAERFFGPTNIMLQHRKPRYLSLSYEYRNLPIDEYFLQLLTAFPTLWIKNEYNTEDGVCGLWIGRTINGLPAVQALEWQELIIEELVYAEDFSLPLDH